jgi:hypothetical protein
MGGGVTPIAGLRLGAGYAHGTYRQPTTATASAPLPQTEARSATAFNLEGEYRSSSPDGSFRNLRDP